jgi:two-component system, OmpR family, alkaline phosphatase synthesis response regulator PhoP
MTPRILIAEDEESIVASLEFLMRDAGFETRVARDGPAAIGLLGDFRPHLVLLDIMLPGRSGFEVCRLIRGDPSMKDTRVLMLTARGGARDEERGVDAGADGYMTKPFSTKDLVARVRSLLGEAVAR